MISKRNILVHFGLCLVLKPWYVAVADSHIPVVTTTTDLAWLMKKIGSPYVEVQSLLRGHENPHYVDAVPDYIRLVANAKVVCLVGLDLEIGWMPKVLSKSGNSDVQPGAKGYCETARSVEVLEKPTSTVDRSMGDTHPAGNPHFWLSPEHLAQAALPMVESLSAVDPVHAAEYKVHAEEVKKQLLAIKKKNEGQLKPWLKKFTGPLATQYHKEFSYFFSAYGIATIESIEEKPGVPPSAGRIADMAIKAKNAKIKLAFASTSAPKSTLARFKELTGIAVIQVATSMNPKEGIESYDQFQESLVGAIIKALREVK